MSPTMRAQFRSSTVLLLLLLFSTLLVAESFCATTSNETLYNDATFEPELGNANMLRPGFRQAWPRLPKSRHRFQVLRYCYANQAARDALDCSVIRPALSVWASALGSPFSLDPGHSLAWKEVTSIVKDRDPVALPVYCFTEGGTAWNEVVAHDTLAIHVVQGAIPQATVGWTNSGDPGRHKMILPADPGLHQVVHEIGHVLGMIHEQCRNDRDDFLEYKCQNVKGYNTALLKAIMEGEKDASTRLCEDKDFAHRYNFDGSQFTKNAGYDFFPGRLDEGRFDMASVMIYPSNAFSNPACTPANIQACPLAGIDKINDRVVGKSWMYGNVAPSAGDIAFVKKWYPWHKDMETPPPKKVEKRGIVRLHTFEMVSGKIVLRQD